MRGYQAIGVITIELKDTETFIILTSIQMLSNNNRIESENSLSIIVSSSAWRSNNNRIERYHSNISIMYFLSVGVITIELKARLLMRLFPLNPFYWSNNNRIESKLNVAPIIPSIPRVITIELKDI